MSTYSQAFERIKREHPTWDASQIAAEMQRRSVLARRRKGRWQGQNQPKPAAYWWQND